MTLKSDRDKLYERILEDCEVGFDGNDGAGMPRWEPARYRPHEWINTQTLKPVYSIQARLGRNGWAQVYEGGKPLFFDDRAARDAKLREMYDVG